VVGGERADLEVLFPFRMRWRDPVLAGQAEAELRVVPGRAEQRDEGLSQSVGRAEDRVHESLAHASSLSVRPDRQRAERQDRSGADCSPCADDVADDVTVRAFSHERQFWNPCLARAQPVNQRRLYRDVRSGLAESGRGDRADRLHVPRRLSAYQHDRTMPGLAGRTQLVFARSRNREAFFMIN
jgi:hypothetical protein